MEPGDRVQQGFARLLIGAHCYAETFAERWRGTPGHVYENGFDLQLRPERLEQPRKWTRPRMIFVNSMSDLFHEGVPAEYVWRVLDVARECPQHVFQVLTKRPERMRQLVNDWYALSYPLGDAPAVPNLWLGVSIENRRFVWRADVLRETHAAVRFISAEPLLGPLVPSATVDEGEYWGPPYNRVMDAPALSLEGIDWLIVGGESGPGHRPIRPMWVRDLQAWAQTRGTAFFFKQLGNSMAREYGVRGKGADWDEWPEELDDLKIREMPDA